MKKHRLVAKIVIIGTLAIFLLSTILTAVMYLGESSSSSGTGEIATGVNATTGSSLSSTGTY